MFNNYIYKKIAKYINQCCENWISEYPKDEWLLAKMSGYEERDTDLPMLFFPAVRYIREDEEIEQENMTVFKRIINVVWEENTTSLSIVSRSIFLLLYIKTISMRGHINEMMVGLIFGIILQFIDIIKSMINYMRRWYFGDKTGMDIHKIIMRPNKYSVKFLSAIPFLIIFLLNILKANVYSRIIGEWMIDMSHIYLYFAQIAGYLIIQNIFRIIDYTRYSASILFLLIIYAMILVFI
jgi:hypothetical protein